MRVPKREDQSLFILLFNCHTSIILDLLGLSTLFLSFFSKWRWKDSNPRLRSSDMRAYHESTTSTSPIKRQCGLGRRFPEIITALSRILSEDFTPHQDLLFVLYIYKT